MSKIVKRNSKLIRNKLAYNNEMQIGLIPANGSSLIKVKRNSTERKENDDIDEA